MMQKPGIARPLVVPVHGSKPLKRGTFLGLLKQAGITQADAIDRLRDI